MMGQEGVYTSEGRPRLRKLVVTRACCQGVMEWANRTPPERWRMLGAW